jgi:hypothetical protein
LGGCRKEEEGWGQSCGAAALLVFNGTRRPRAVSCPRCRPNESTLFRLTEDNYRFCAGVTLFSLSSFPPLPRIRSYVDVRSGVVRQSRHWPKTCRGIESVICVTRKPPRKNPRNPIPLLTFGYISTYILSLGPFYAPCSLYPTFEVLKIIEQKWTAKVSQPLGLR